MNNQILSEIQDLTAEEQEQLLESIQKIKSSRKTWYEELKEEICGRENQGNVDGMMVATLGKIYEIFELDGRPPYQELSCDELKSELEKLGYPVTVSPSQRDTLSSKGIIAVTNLPDGAYNGTWCAYTIKLPQGQIIRTFDGIRGFREVKLVVKNGQVTEC